MSTPQVVEQVRAKLRNADRHIAELNETMLRFAKTHPFKVGKRNTAQHTEYFLTAVAPIPTEIPLLLGDALQNLRATLDHLAYQLVLSGSGRPPGAKCYFPIEGDEANFNRVAPQKLAGATPAAFAAVSTLKPYKGGCDPLWQLNKLANIDKHRFVLTAAGSYRSFNIGQSLMVDVREACKSWGLPPPPADFGMNLHMAPKDKKFPLKAGDILFQDQLRPNPPSIDFAFDISVNEAEIGTTLPIAEMLNASRAEVARAIDTLAPLL